MPKTSDDIKNITLRKHNNYFVRGEKGKLKCMLVQETDWLFIFKVSNEINENDKRKFCISKVDYYLNTVIIQETF